MGLGKTKSCGTKTRKWIPLLFVALWMPVTWDRGVLTGKTGADPSEGKAPAALGPGGGSGESACEQYRHWDQKHQVLHLPQGTQDLKAFLQPFSSHYLEP